MNIKTMTAVAATAAASLVHAATPLVTSVSMAQSSSSRLVTISYTLVNAPAVVTLDVQTNRTGSATSSADDWVSIGGAAVCNAQGDVWKKVGSSGTFNGTITWRPDQSWPDHIVTGNGARAVVTAWALDNTPNYMVVDISAGAQQNTQKYYPAVEFLPGGLLGNTDYRTSMLVMRKIMAKDVTWTMGSTTLEPYRDTDENTFRVSLTNNYYIGVFEITQSQWELVQTNRPAPSYFTDLADRPMRPVEQVSYNEIRNVDNRTTSANWPADPDEASFLGILNRRTGLDFELPSEAQWEFAARAGNGDTRWGEGSVIQDDANSGKRDANLARLGRYLSNGGYVGSSEPAATCGATNGTAIAGTYAPNDWGLYDMHGNVWEWCLDWYQADITANGGIVNIDTSDATKPLSGTASTRVVRGGTWNNLANLCRSASRYSYSPATATYKHVGFRVVCTAGLQ